MQKELVSAGVSVSVDGSVGTDVCASTGVRVSADVCVDFALILRFIYHLCLVLSHLTLTFIVATICIALNICTHASAWGSTHE